LGIEAGQILKKIHQIPINHSIPWWLTYQEKIVKKIMNIRKCSIDLPHKEMLIDYILKNKQLVQFRDTTYTHGDFHLGNMIYNGKINIIDFDKFGIADPYDDLKPFCWYVFQSSYFATGIIDGYFDYHIPDDFFQY